MPSLQRSRRHRIVALVGEQGEATVAEMATRFGVSGMTIRRDLYELERQGYVERTHGGAVAPAARSAFGEPAWNQRLREATGEKCRIAHAVAAMVDDGETVFLGSGTTTLAVAETLAAERRLTVVTNAVTVINALAGATGVELVVTGGILRRQEMSLIGPFAEHHLQDVRVDKVIMGVRGIDAEHGLTSEHLHELQTDRAILQTSDEIVVVADHTKFSQTGSSRMAPITAASTVVTDSRAPSHEVEAIRNAGVEVVLVEAAEGANHQ